MTATRRDAQLAVPDFDERAAAALATSTVRRVRDSIDRARMAWEPEGAGAGLVEAEIAAGLRPVDDWHGRFTPEVWQTPPTTTR